MVDFLLSVVPLFIFVAVATASPGGATTLAAASGVQFGFRRSIPLIAGISCGLASLAIAAALGLATILLAVPMLQAFVKGIGTAYLLWLAWKIGSKDLSSTVMESRWSLISHLLNGGNI